MKVKLRSLKQNVLLKNSYLVCSFMVVGQNKCYLPRGEKTNDENAKPIWFLINWIAEEAKKSFILKKKLLKFLFIIHKIKNFQIFESFNGFKFDSKPEIEISFSFTLFILRTSTLGAPEKKEN